MQPLTRPLLIAALAAALFAAVPVTPATAQAPPPAAPPAGAPPGSKPAPRPRLWSGSVSAGISVTAGNRNTSNFNASFDLTRDSKAGNVLKADAFYLRGTSEKNLTGDQLRFGIYDEHRFNSRFFAFGQARYMRDRFKDIEYLVAPATGMGYKVHDSPASSLGLAAGLGGVWEKDRGQRRSAGGSLTLDQKLSWKFSPSATITQSLAGLWKTTNFSDSLYSLRVTVAASLTSRAQLKFEVSDTFKNRPTGGLMRNDITLISGLVYKI